MFQNQRFTTSCSPGHYWQVEVIFTVTLILPSNVLYFIYQRFVVHRNNKTHGMTEHSVLSCYYGVVGSWCAADLWYCCLCIYHSIAGPQPSLPKPCGTLLMSYHYKKTYYVQTVMDYRNNILLFTCGGIPVAALF